MAEMVLNDLIDEWQAEAGRGLRLSFPQALEARFEDDTGPARCRSMMVSGLLGYLFAACLYPAICDTMPDIPGAVRNLYLLAVIPFGLLTSAALVLNPGPVLRESLMLSAHLVCICVVAYLEATTRVTNTAFYVSGITVMMVFSCVGIQLRFWFAAFAVMFNLVAYGVALYAETSVSAATPRNLLVLGACNAAYLMLANWRLERETRRSYLINLRERLQRQDLSMRNQELDALARRDQLTGLANRRAYDTWVLSTWEQQSARGGQLGLIVVDIDRFKAYNDYYGHAAGDRCLQTIALCLREQLRGTTDLVARLGGEEFATLLPGLHADLCADIAERMRAAVQQLELPHLGIGSHGLVTISAGVASFPATAHATPCFLFDTADSAMYEAKMAGRNRVCVATLPACREISAAAAE